MVDKQRVKGSAEEAKGGLKETAGKVLGDKKLQGEGKADKTSGSIRNAVGSAKDAIKDVFKK